MGRDQGDGDAGEQHAPRSVDPGLADEVSSSVMKKLRDEYDALVAQPVPDRFRGLLEKLERAGGTDPAAGADLSGRCRPVQNSQSDNRSGSGQDAGDAGNDVASGQRADDE